MGAWKPPCATSSGVHPHGGLEVVIRFEVVVGIGRVATDTTITREAQYGNANRAPLCLGEGHRAEVKGQNVGSDGHGEIPFG